jgi:D-alanyl-D-alanine carboxypeptidase
VTQYQAANHDPGMLVDIWSPMGHYLKASGVADLATGEPITTNMQYQIGSETKTFTAELILQLVGKGKVGLGDHISKWIAGVPNGNEITIRELLNHTSGLGDVLAAPTIAAKWDTGGVCTPHELLATGATLPPVAPPGQGWHYSNYGYDLLGRVIELATHQQLATVVQKRIVGPLGLRRTLFPTSGNGLSAPFTHGYGEIAPTAAPTVANDTSSFSASCGWAAGAMVSTLSDMRIWSKALATGALLEPAVQKEAISNPVSVDPSLHAYFGLGFVELPGGFRGWAGDTLGYSSTAMYSPQHQTAIITLVNKQSNDPSNLRFSYNIARVLDG